MGEALMEEAPPTAADTPASRGLTSRGADILTAALAAVVTFRRLAWTVDTRTAGEQVVVPMPSLEDFLLIPPAVSRAILSQEMKGSARPPAPAISAASDLRNRWHKDLAAAWVRGRPSEIRPAGRCSPRRARRGAWGRVGILLAM